MAITLLSASELAWIFSALIDIDESFLEGNIEEIIKSILFCNIEEWEKVNKVTAANSRSYAQNYHWRKIQYPEPYKNPLALIKNISYVKSNIKHFALNIHLVNIKLKLAEIASRPYAIHEGWEQTDEISSDVIEAYL